MRAIILRERSDTYRDPEQTDIQIYESRDFLERVDNAGCVLRDTDAVFHG